MLEIRQTEAFGTWMRGLRDQQGRAVIARAEATRARSAEILLVPGNWPGSWSNQP